MIDFVTEWSSSSGPFNGNWLQGHPLVRLWTPPNSYPYISIKHASRPSVMPSSLAGKKRRTYDIPGSHRFWCYPFEDPYTAWILPLCRCRHTYLMVNDGSLGCNKQKTSYPRPWLELQSKNTENAHPICLCIPPQICQSKSISAFPTEEPCGLCHKPHGASRAGGSTVCQCHTHTPDIYLLLPDPSTVPSDSPAMYSLRALLLALLLTVLQFVLSVDAKGGGKGGGSKSSKTSKSKKKPVILQENGKCYNEQYAALFLFALSLSSSLDTQDTSRWSVLPRRTLP